MKIPVGCHLYSETPNSQLADKIIAAGGGDEYVKEICSGSFVLDPTAHLVHEMIERRVGRCRGDDGARAFVIGQIPGFIEKVSSPAYLKSLAISYFSNDPNYAKIMQVFEKSLINAEFQRDLKIAVNHYNKATEKSEYFYCADHSLRVALTIYAQAAELEEYSHPAYANME